MSEKGIKGKKRFAAVLLTSKELQGAHIKEVRRNFIKLCEEAILDPHLATVNFYNSPRRKHYHFVLSFGVRRTDEDKIFSLLKSLAQASLWFVVADSCLKKAQKAAYDAASTYKQECLLSTVRLTVKPKEHIKLC